MFTFKTFWLLKSRCKHLVMRIYHSNYSKFSIGGGHQTEEPELRSELVEEVRVSL